MLTRNVVIRLTAAAALLALALAAVMGSAAQDGAAPYLGVTIAPDEAGARVLMVASNSPADAAGLQAGDIITAVDETKVTAETLAETIQGYAVGDTVTLSVTRNGEALEVEATLAERPAAETATTPPIRVAPRLAQTGAYLGVTLEQSAAGVTIADVAADSPAEQAGLEAGDIITAVNDDAVQRVADVVNAVRAAKPGDTLALTVERGGETLNIEATLGETSSVTFGMGPMRGLRLSADLALYIEPTGWHIISLDEDGALYAAGLRAGDIVTAVDGEARTPEALDEYLGGLDADAEVALTVTRGGEQIEVNAPASALESLNRLDVMGQMPFFGDGQGRRGQLIPDMPMLRGGVRLGVVFQTLTADIAAENNLDVTEGALITEVLADSPAETAGLQAGDVVTAVEGDPVDARRTLSDRLYAYDPGDTVVLTVLRDGETLEIEVVLGQPDAGALNIPFFGGRDSDGAGRSFRFMIPPEGRGFRFEIPAPEAPAATPESGANL